jgi:uncharacterized hydrophobic protein (TIGR00341 family)
MQVEQVIQSSAVSYYRSEGKSYGKSVVHYLILAPDEIANGLLDDLSKKLNLDDKLNVINVLRPDATFSGYIEKLAEKFRGAKGPSPVEQLLSSTEQFMRLSSAVLVTALIASAIALFGLFGNNSEIVIGGMLISPLLGPINAFTVNASLGRVRKMISSLIATGLLLFSAISISAIATFVTFLFVRLPLTNEINLRTTVSPLDLAVALLLGIASSLALAGRLPEILVGVSVAVALVPPAVVSGIGIALLNSRILAGALALTFSNMLGLQLGGILTLVSKGIVPRKYYEKEIARRRTLYTIIVLILLAASLAVLDSYLHP